EPALHAGLPASVRDLRRRARRGHQCADGDRVGARWLVGIAPARTPRGGCVVIVGNGFIWVRRIGLTLLTLFIAVPLYAMAMTAFLPNADVQGEFQWIPDRVSLDAFAEMWRTVPLAHYLRNSLIVSVTATVVAIAIAVPAA